MVENDERLFDVLKKETFKSRSLLYLLGAVTGAFAGLGAVVFRYLILSASYLFAAIPNTVGVLGWVVAPVIGGLSVAVITIRLAPEAKQLGIPQVITAYSFRGGKMRTRIPPVRTIASALSISSGGSCGTVGPVAQIGAGIGSVTATKLGLTKKDRKTLLVCGVSSSIAATFNAPLGGTCFGIEVIAGGIAGFSVVPVILSTVMATAISNVLLGNSPFITAPDFTFGNPVELIFYLAMGLLFGVGSFLWSRGFYYFEDLLKKLKVSDYILPAVGGLLVGSLGLLTLYLEGFFGYVGVFGPQEPYFPAIMGVGYVFINTSLLSNVGIAVLLIFAVLKAIATSLTLGSGGSGGIFAPTMFLGAALGGVFGLVVSLVSPGIVQQPMAYALVGMAALFAAIGKAPMTAVLMTVEMTHDYLMVVPLMAAVSASYLMSSFISEESIYTMKPNRREVHRRRDVYVDALKAVEVEEVMTQEPTILRPDMSTDEVLDIVESTHHTKYPVIDSDGNIVGTVITEDLFAMMPSVETRVVSDLMDTDFLRVSNASEMDSVVHAMMQRQEGHAVVVDNSEPRKMLGFVTKADVLEAYEIAIKRLREQGMDIEDIKLP